MYQKRSIGIFFVLLIISIVSGIEPLIKKSKGKKCFFNCSSFPSNVENRVVGPFGHVFKRSFETFGVKMSRKEKLNVNNTNFSSEPSRKNVSINGSIGMNSSLTELKNSPSETTKEIKLSKNDNVKRHPDSFKHLLFKPLEKNVNILKKNSMGFVKTLVKYRTNVNSKHIRKENKYKPNQNEKKYSQRENVISKPSRKYQMKKSTGEPRAIPLYTSKPFITRNDNVKIFTRRNRFTRPTSNYQFFTHEYLHYVTRYRPNKYIKNTWQPETTTPPACETSIYVEEGNIKARSDGTVKGFTMGTTILICLVAIIILIISLPDKILIKIKKHVM